jgi:hypothetical protein
VHDTDGAQARATIEVGKGSSGIRGTAAARQSDPQSIVLMSGKTRHAVFSQKIQTTEEECGRVLCK